MRELPYFCNQKFNSLTSKIEKEYECKETDSDGYDGYGTGRL